MWFSIPLGSSTAVAVCLVLVSPILGSCGGESAPTSSTVNESPAPAGPVESAAPSCDAASLTAGLQSVSDHGELLRRTQVAQECRQWEAFIAITRQLAARDDRPEARGRYLYVIAVIYRDELHDPDAAARAFEEVLQADPNMVGAREALDALRGR